MHTKRQKRIKFCVYLALYVVTFAIVSSVFVISAVTNYSFPLLRVVIITFASVLLMKYFIYMIMSPWYDVVTALRDHKYREALKAHNPRVSVMVPAWNESHGVLETIKTIIKSSHANLEVVVVNDGSTDDSDALIRKFKHEYDIQNKDNPNKVDIVYHYKENGGKGAALNTALELATGEILMSIDADCILLPDTIKNFVRPFIDPNVMAAVGNVKVGNTQTVVGIVQNLEFLFSFYFKKADSVMGTVYIIGGAAGAFRRETIEAVGNYNTKNITEDIELSVRIQDAGMKIVYASDALI
jgi:biofilm PGA synthesis N-glycosyltransferase PgaC